MARSTPSRPATSGSPARSARSSSARPTPAERRSSSSTAASGKPRNERLFASLSVQDKTIAALVALARKIGVDGIDVDVEQLGDDLVPAYGAFVGRLRGALRAAMPDGRVSVATSAGLTGAAMAQVAAAAGADRIFLMGYDYHYAGSDVGASAPMDRRDGESRRPRLVARPVRVARRAGRAHDPRAAAVRDALARRRPGARRRATR